MVSDLSKYAELGARLRLEQLEAEKTELQSFLSRVPTMPESNGHRRGRRRPMSTAERRSVSERMTRYWSERRAAKARAFKAARAAGRR